MSTSYSSTPCCSENYGVSSPSPSPSQSSQPQCIHQIICFCRKPTVTYVSQKPRSRGRLFHTCVNSLTGGCKFFLWADVIGVPAAAQGDFPAMCKRIDSLVSENLELVQKLKDAAQGEKNALEMAEELKNNMMHMAEEVSKLKQLQVVLLIVIILSWTPTILKLMG